MVRIQLVQGTQRVSRKTGENVGETDTGREEVQGLTHRFHCSSEVPLVVSLSFGCNAA